jgi:hypothetical protein
MPYLNKKLLVQKNVSVNSKACCVRWFDQTDGVGFISILKYEVEEKSQTQALILAQPKN